MSTAIIAGILALCAACLWSRAMQITNPDVTVRVVANDRGDWAIELPDGFRIGNYPTAADAAYFAGLNGWEVKD